MAAVLRAERLGSEWPGVVAPAASVALVVAWDRGVFVFQRDTGQRETPVVQRQAQAQARRALPGESLVAGGASPPCSRVLADHLSVAGDSVSFSYLSAKTMRVHRRALRKRPCGTYPGQCKSHP